MAGSASVTRPFTCQNMLFVTGPITVPVKAEVFLCFGSKFLGSTDELAHENLRKAMGGTVALSSLCFRLTLRKTLCGF